MILETTLVAVTLIIIIKWECIYVILLIWTKYLSTNFPGTLILVCILRAPLIVPYPKFQYTNGENVNI